MRRWLRFTLIGTGALTLTAIAAAALFAVTFDPNTQKTRIVEAVRRATGRDLVLAGPLRLSLGWTPVLEAEDAAFANRSGGSRPQMATVGRMQASLALLPLLSRRIEIETVTLDRPDILLETDAQGIGNWQFQRPAAPAGPSTGASHAGTAVALHRLVVENGRVTWRNGATGRSTAIDVAHGVLTLDGGTALVAADARSGGQTLHLDAMMASAASGPWPVKLALDVGGGRLALDGAVAWPLSERSYQGKVAATLPDLGALGALLDLPGLPGLHDVQLGLVLGADGIMAPHDVTLHAGAADLGGLLPGATLAQVDLALPALGGAGRLTAAGGLSGGPWRLAAGVTVTQHLISLRGLNLATPGGDLAGDVALAQGDRWALRGSLVSQRLDADWLRGLVKPAAPGPAPADQPAAPPAAPAPPRVFSEAKLPWGRLRAADADLQFAVAALHIAGAEYHSVSGHVALQDGALRLDPFTMLAPEGRIDGSLALDAAQPEPPVTFAMRSAAFALDPLLQAVRLPGGSDAPVEVDVALTSAGQSPHDLASRLTGHAGLAMVDGAIANAVLAAALDGIVPPAAGRLDAAGRSAVRCMALRLDARAGQVTVAALRLDTSRLDLAGSGAIDLAGERLDLRLRPTVRLGGAGVTAPVRVEGALAHPAAVMDALGVDGRPGIVIGGPPPPDECAPALALARDGRPGRQPAAPAPGKAPKPVDLLRSLLR